MTSSSLSRGPAYGQVSWRGVRWVTSSTTDRWQDKGARGVLVVGCVISRGYGAKSQLVCHMRSLRHFRFPILFNYLARCAEHVL